MEEYQEIGYFFLGHYKMKLLAQVDLVIKKSTCQVNYFHKMHIVQI